MERLHCQCRACFSHLLKLLVLYINSGWFSISFKQCVGIQMRIKWAKEIFCMMIILPPNISISFFLSTNPVTDYELLVTCRHVLLFRNSHYSQGNSSNTNHKFTQACLKPFFYFHVKNKTLINVIYWKNCFFIVIILHSITGFCNYDNDNKSLNWLDWETYQNKQIC